MDIGLLRKIFLDQGKIPCAQTSHKDSHIVVLFFLLLLFHKNKEKPFLLMISAGLYFQLFVTTAA